MNKLILCLIPFVFLGSTTTLADQTQPTTAIQMGTGWVVAPHFVVTNNHVVAGSDDAVLIKTDRSKLNAQVVVRDVANDLALLKVTDTGQLPPALPLVKHTPLMGEQVFTIGYPHPDVMGTNPKLTVGIINSLTGMANDPRTFQISTPLQAGNSGGPLLNMKGEVVGIVTSKLNAAKMFEWTGDIPQNVNYAVKINYLRALIDSTHHSRQTPLPILPATQNTLVNLSQQIQDSIVLIQSGAITTMSRQSTMKKKDKSEKKPEPGNVKKVAIFTYMERGDYDYQGDMDSTEVYSKNTATLVENYIKKYMHDSLQIQYLQHDLNSKWRYYDVHKIKEAQGLCKKYGVDYLLAIKNEFDLTNHFEEVEFVLKDCTKSDYVQRGYQIEDKTGEKFYFETDIRAAFIKFVDEFLPATEQRRNICFRNS